MIFSNKPYIILFILLLVKFFIAISQTTFEHTLEKLYNHTVPILKVSQVENSNAIFLDTRSKKEFEVSHLENAQFIDYESFELNQLNLPINTEDTIIVYCSVGYRSEKVGEQLIEAGYTNVFNLYGGIFEWKNNQYPVYNSNGDLTDSVHTYNKDWSKWLTNGIKVYE